MARAVVPVMLEAGAGKVINVGAGAGQAGAGADGRLQRHPKSVVIRLTEAMAEELKEQGINVNCVLPSIIDTERNRSDMPDADFSRWVTPEAMAEVIGFSRLGSCGPDPRCAVPVAGPRADDPSSPNPGFRLAYDRLPETARNHRGRTAAALARISDLEVPHPTHRNGVIAGIVFGFQIAIDVGDHSVQNG